MGICAWGFAGGNQSILSQFLKEKPNFKTLALNGQASLHHLKVSEMSYTGSGTPLRLAVVVILVSSGTPWTFREEKEDVDR